MEEKVIMDLYENPVTLKVSEASLINFYRKVQDKNGFLLLMNFMDIVNVATKEQINTFFKFNKLTLNTTNWIDIDTAVRFNILNKFIVDDVEYFTININTKMFIVKFANNESVFFNGFHNIPLLESEVEQQDNITNLYLSLFQIENSDDFRLRNGYRIPVFKKQSSKPYIEGIPISHLVLYPKYVYDYKENEYLVQYIYENSGILNKLEMYAGLLSQENDFKLCLLLQKDSRNMLEKVIKKIVQLEMPMEKIVFLKWSDLAKYKYKEYSLSAILKEIKEKTFAI